MSAAVDERLDLLDALVYGDAFDCAITFDELWRYARVPVARDELESRLRDDPAVRSMVRERGGLYCLADRPELLDLRPAGVEQARRLEHRARRVARLLRRLPFVEGVALTGSAAAGDAAPGADVDLLIVVEPGRLGTAFLLLGTASRILGRRVLCPNYYVSADALAAELDSVYVARELAQARVLAGGDDSLRAANAWIHDVFPNLGAAATEGAGPRNRAARIGPVGRRIERLGRHVAARRLRAHYGAFDATVPAGIVRALGDGRALRFHAGGAVEAALARYEVRRSELAAALDGGSLNRT